MTRFMCVGVRISQFLGCKCRAWAGLGSGALATSHCRAVLVLSHVVLCNSLTFCMCCVWFQALFWAFGCKDRKVGRPVLLLECGRQNSKVGPEIPAPGYVPWEVLSS